MSWTQPVCTHCWIEENSVLDEQGGALIRKPIQLIDPGFMEALVNCCKCGRATTSRIWLRIDPTTVPYPHEED